jgi:hypothetical protein
MELSIYESRRVEIITLWTTTHEGIEFMLRNDADGKRKITSIQIKKPRTEK